jgi:hypothetical protein
MRPVSQKCLKRRDDAPIKAGVARDPRRIVEPEARMKMSGRLIALCMLLASHVASGAALDAAAQAKVDAKVKEIQSWAADRAVVEAVKAYNGAKSAEAAAMDQPQWSAATVLDPFVRSLTKNTAAEFLKAHKGDVVSEAFVSGADGGKVAFLAKPTNWSHKGKPKHDAPMSGKTWRGDIEVDQSSGLQQIQVAVPVLDGARPIGSLVVGLSVIKLTH